MMQHNYLAYPAQAYQVILHTVTKASGMKNLTKTTFKSGSTYNPIQNLSGLSD